MPAAELQMPFGEQLQKLRKAKGLSQLDLSRSTGLSLSIIAQLEQGQATNPRLSTVKALADALGCTLDALGRDPAEGEAPPKRGRKPRGKRE
jgi:transcriptional regulator with XRE-family HTH domain